MPETSPCPPIAISQERLGNVARNMETTQTFEVNRGNWAVKRLTAPKTRGIISPGKGILRNWGSPVRAWLCFFWVVGGGVVPSPIQASVSFQTNIRDVYYRGSSEEAGKIDLVVDANDFSMASEATPVYIRVEYDQDAVLACTWVDVDSPPVYLAMRLFTSASGGYAINADPSAISLIRCRSGEGELWLKVTQPSDEWVLHVPSGQTMAPSIDIRAAWSVGETARFSHWTNFSLFNDGLANGPFNVLVPGSSDIEDSASTLFCVALSESSILPEAIFPDPQDCALHVSASAFDHTTTGVTTQADPTQIALGTPLNVSFGGDDIIGRGVQYSGRIEVVPPVPQTLSVEPSVASIMAVDLNVHVWHSRGLSRQSILTFELPSDLDQGFEVRTDSNNQPLFAVSQQGIDYYWLDNVELTDPQVDFDALVPADSIIEVDGIWLARRADLIVINNDWPHVYSLDMTFSANILAAELGGCGETHLAFQGVHHSGLSSRRIPCHPGPSASTLSAILSFHRPGKCLSRHVSVVRSGFHLIQGRADRLDPRVGRVACCC